MPTSYDRDATQAVVFNLHWRVTSGMAFQERRIICLFDWVMMATRIHLQDIRQSAGVGAADFSDHAWRRSVCV